MDAIPLIRARYLQTFAAVVERTGARPQRLLEAAKIPVGILENPDALHPALQLFDFAGRAARVTGHFGLGLVAGRTKLEDHGAFGNRVSGAPTLHQALETFCAEALEEYSRAFFSIERRGDDIWFCRERIDGQRDERQQIELYLVELMLQTIRLVTGPDWQPGELWLQSTDERVLRDFEPLAQLNVRCGCPILAIPIPKSVMSKTLPRNDRRGSLATGRSGEQAPAKPPAADFVGSLRQVIETYLPGRNAKIETAAEVAGMSVRSLQRRLGAAGTTYSRLVDKVRLRTALPLLEDPDILLAEIAYDLGYSHPAHFTRAFRRWAGVTPSEYRADMLAS